MQRTVRAYVANGCGHEHLGVAGSPGSDHLPVVCGSQTEAHLPSDGSKIASAAERRQPPREPAEPLGYFQGLPCVPKPENSALPPFMMVTLIEHRITPTVRAGNSGGG